MFRGGFWRTLTIVLTGSLLVWGLPRAAAALTPPDDGHRFDGSPWDPENDEYSRQVFAGFDAAAVAPHVKPSFENLRPGDRPPNFQAFLVAGLIGVPLFVAVVIFLRVWLPTRRGRRRPGRESFEIPDDAGPVALAMLLALVARVIAVVLLPLHGSEWGSVELKPISELPDVLFNGYEVLTNPSLLNTIEHFIFPICVSPLCFRMPILLFGLALVWAARCAARELAGRRAGIIAAFLAAINAGLIVWSATMRAYLPMATFVLAALPAAWRLSTGPGRDRDAALLGIFGALAVWTHYIAWIWLGMYFVLIAWGRRKNLSHLWRPLVAGLFVVVAFLPLMPFFFGDFGDKQGASLPAGWWPQMLALATGMPGPVGLVVPAGMVMARFHRSRGALWLTAVCLGYLGACLATSPIIFWEVSYSVGLAAVVTVLCAVVIDRFRRWRTALAVAVLALSASTLLICLEPSDSPLVSKLTRPFLWRSVSSALFARTIADSPASRDGVQDAVIVTPAFDSESFLYHLGPVTPAEAGVEPVILRNFDEMKIPPIDGRDPVTLIGFERYWGWHLGQWPELQRYSARFPAFWYARMQQSCARRDGLTYSSYDCAWLRSRCELVESTAFDELYLCAAGTR